MSDVASRSTQEKPAPSYQPGSQATPAPRPRASLVRRLGQYALLGIVVVLAIEVTARIDDWIRLGVPFMHTASGADLRVTDSLGTHGRPLGRYQGWKLNNFGFRGPSMTALPRPGCTRIMILGASETMGYYETPGKEFAAQLRDSLKPFGCFDVVNAGIPGIGTKSIVALWNQYADRFGAQIVMIYPTPAFYLGDETRGWPSPDPGTRTGTLPPQPSSSPTWASVPWQPRLIDRLHQTLHTPDFLQRLRLERWIAQALRGKPPGWVWTQPPTDRVDAFMKDLDSLVTDIRAAGARPILITHAVRATVPPRPEDALLLLGWRLYSPRATTETSLRFEAVVAQQMREYGARNGIAVADVERALTGHGELFGDVVHFSNDGSARVAGVLTRTLVSAGLAGPNPGSAPVGEAHP